MRAITDQEYKRLYAVIQNPPPGSKLEEANNYGIDLIMLLRNLTLTLEERTKRMESLARFAKELHLNSPILISQTDPDKPIYESELLELEALREIHKLIESPDQGRSREFRE
jgi:hypothetical protein